MQIRAGITYFCFSASFTKSKKCGLTNAEIVTSFEFITQVHP